MRDLIVSRSFTTCWSDMSSIPDIFRVENLIVFEGRTDFVQSFFVGNKQHHEGVFQWSVHGISEKEAMSRRPYYDDEDHDIHPCHTLLWGDPCPSAPVAAMGTMGFSNPMTSNLLSNDNIIAFRDDITVMDPGLVLTNTGYLGGKEGDEDMAKLDQSYKSAMRFLKDFCTFRPSGMKNQPYAPYTPIHEVEEANQITLKACANGQTKLICGEIRFFETFYKQFVDNSLSNGSVVKYKPFRWNKNDYNSAVFYLGASDGYHIAHFTELYPHTVFVLVDPRNPRWGDKDKFPSLVHIGQAWTTKEHVHNFFRGKLNSNNPLPKEEGPPDGEDSKKPEPKFHFPVYKIKDYEKKRYMGLAESIRKSRCPVLFISDIRSIDTRKHGEKEGDEQVLKDEKVQHLLLEATREWCNVIAYNLKFRAPYGFTKGATMQTTPKHSRTKGDLWIQPYAPGNSTEMRVVGSTNGLGKKPIGEELYNPWYVQDVMAYVNRVYRFHNHFDSDTVVAILQMVKHNRPHEWRYFFLRLLHAILDLNISNEDKLLIRDEEMVPMS